MGNCKAEQLYNMLFATQQLYEMQTSKQNSCKRKPQNIHTTSQLARQ
jgi:hypothetical protein